HGRVAHLTGRVAGTARWITLLAAVDHAVPARWKRRRRDADERGHGRGGGRGRARVRRGLAEERDGALGLLRLPADLAAPRHRPVLLRLHRDDAREAPAHGARAVGRDLDLPDPPGTEGRARGADLPLLEVLQRAAGLGLVDAQLQVECAFVADRVRADGPSVRDGAAGL